MAVPPLTDEQRADALAKAAAARRDRSELRAKIRTGNLDLADLLDSAEQSTDGALTKMRVSALLKALPGVGKTRAAQIMRRLDISANRRVGGLGVHQRAALLGEFERRASAQRTRTSELDPEKSSSGLATGR